MTADLNHPPGVDQSMHDSVFADRCEPNCTFCSMPIRNEDTASVEIVNTKVPGGAEFFCNGDCRSNHVYAETNTATGRAALIRFVAALQLLVDEDVMALAPALTRYECDEFVYETFPAVRHADIQQFREHAMAFFKVLGGNDGVDWAAKACALSDTLATMAGKEVA